MFELLPTSASVGFLWITLTEAATMTKAIQGISQPIAETVP